MLMRRILSLTVMLSLFLTVMAQRQIKGMVVDGDAEPLVGALVKLDGDPARMVTTDVDGRFFIDAPDHAVYLDISYICLLYTSPSPRDRG